MEEFRRIETRLRHAASIADLLTVSFDAFELIRRIARDCDDQVPEQFAAFIMTADAAVDGREAVTTAPSLPPPGSGQHRYAPPAADSGVGEITDALAALGTLLTDRLAHTATTAAAPADQAACTDAAHAAERITHLMARGDHDGSVR